MANGFIRAVLTLMTGAALGQAIGLATTPIVSRIYDTSAYGEYALFTSIATVFAVVSQAGLASAIMMPKEDAEARMVFNSAFIFMVAFVSIAFLTLIVISPFFRIFSFGTSYAYILTALAFHMLLTNASNLLRVYVNRLKMYRVLFWNSIISASVTLAITIPLGILGAGVWGFIMAGIIGNAICVAQMLMKANPFSRLGLAQFKQVLSNYRRFIFLQFPANMMDTLSQQLPNQILGSAFGSASLGSYSMSNKILGIPSRLIAAPVNTVYFRTAVEYVQKGKDLASFTFKMVKKILYCASVPIIVLIAFGEPLFSFVLGSQWEEAGLLSAMLSFQYALTFCQTCVSYCRVALDRQGVNMAMSICNLAIVGTSLLVGIVLFVNPIQVVACFALGSCLVQMIDMLINFICLKHYAFSYVIFIVTYLCIVGFIGLGIRFAVQSAIGFASW